MADHSPRFLSLVAEVRKSIKECDIQTVKRKMEVGDRFLLIDVREESEWANGHLPQAVYLGKGVLERDIEHVVPNPATEIVLYCGGGFRSALAAHNLGRMGYTNVTSMDGGFRAWTAADLPIVKGAKHD